MKKDQDALFAIPAIITLTYLAVILAINCVIKIIGSSIQNTAFFGDIIAGFIAPYIGALTIYFVYRAYRKQNESHDLQEKSINFQALNQLIQELDQQKSQILTITSKLWLDVYGYNHITNNYSHGVGARISMKYIENEPDIRNLIAFCNQFKFVRHAAQTFNVGNDSKQIIGFKLDNLKKSLVLFQELKFAVNQDFTYEVKEVEERLRAETNAHLTLEEYTILNNELKDALNSI
jgi:hypothetical protein